ncbi:hypothetical protein OXX80_007848 [Metschnikowia pulcherrima]
MDDITNGRMDIYAELGVSPDASSAEIARKYRQMALKYHPDKNDSAEAAEKFQLFLAINSILQDPALRRDYDNIRKQNSSKSSSVDTGVESQIRRFREQLRARENAAKVSKSRNFAAKKGPNVEVLAMQGLKLRRELQAKLQQRKAFTSFRDIAVPSYTHKFIVKDVLLEVTWKHRPEKEAQIDAGLLGQIMAIFGPIKSCGVCGGDDRYVKGRVTFHNTADAERALLHDYRSAQLWDGSSVRKLASLLRSVKRCEDCESENENETMSQDCGIEIDSFLAKIGVSDEAMV